MRKPSDMTFLRIVLHLLLLFILVPLPRCSASPPTLALAVSAAATASTSSNDKNKVLIGGDIQLGGLFPIHSSSETGDSKCGRLDSHRGIQRMEAMIFTLQEINSNPGILRYGRDKIELGGLLFDTCSKDTVALEKALEFVKNSLTHELDGGFVCEYPNGTRLPAIRSTDRRHSKKPIRGVVGGAYSQVSVQVANLLRLFAIPQISYASTSAALSDKARYEYFARTLPPDTEQAKALADIVGYFNWTFVATVFSKGDYGEGGIQSFESEIDKLNVCIAERLFISLEPGKEELDAIVDKLYSQKRARVVVMFTREDHTEKFLDAVRRANISNHFVWISADGWGKSHVPVANNSLEAKGALTLEIATGEIPGFNDYYTGLRQDAPRTTSISGIQFVNPFFDEYRQLKFDCQATATTTAGARISEPNGTQKACEWSHVSNFKQEPKVQFVYDAVYTFAHGLDKVKRLVCQEQPASADTKASGLFDSCVRNITNFPGKEFYNILINESNFFVDSANRKVQFTKSGDGIGTYKIYNYRQDRESKHMDYVPVGEWRKGTGLAWTREIFWSGGYLDVPISRCSEECSIGQKKMYSNKGGANKDKCCWTCADCQPHQRTNDAKDDCIDCGEDEGPTADRTACVPLHIQYMQWSSWYAIVPIILSAAGIMATSFVIITFVRYNETPLVKASGRELSYLLLTGCLICYMMTFLLITKPSAFTCALQRIGIGLGFAVIYASLLAKTNRIARIFDAASRSAKRPPFISPRSQLLIGGALISVQLASTLIWLVLSHPGTRIHHPQRLEAILRCNIDDKSFLVSLFYNVILIMVCTYYAIKTRRIPENFNESKFIGFTMYTTCIIWLAFVPLYYGTHSSFEVQITTQCVSISLSASVALVCLFTPKLYIIFFQPEKNVRKLTMNSNHYKKQPSSSGGSYTNANHKEAASIDSCSTTRLPSQLYRPGDDACGNAVIENDRAFFSLSAASVGDISCAEDSDEAELRGDQFGLKTVNTCQSASQQQQQKQKQTTTAAIMEPHRRSPSPVLQQQQQQQKQGQAVKSLQATVIRQSCGSSESGDSSNFKYEDGFV